MARSPEKGKLARESRNAEDRSNADPRARLGVTVTIPSVSPKQTDYGNASRKRTSGMCDFTVASIPMVTV